MVKKLGQRLWLFCVFVFLYAPILVLIVYSFTSSTMIGAIRGFSLEHYVTLFTTKELLHMIGGTLLLAVTVAFLSTLLGTIGAIGSFYAGKKSGQCINFLNQIPIANAEVVTGFSICGQGHVSAAACRTDGIMRSICVFVGAAEIKTDGSEFI